jgi:hypothetical protein
MKKSLFMLGFALVAMLCFQTVNAQSLASYTADFDEGASSLTVSGKVGGLGSKTRTMEVTLYIEVEASVDCNKVAGPNLLEKTFYQFSENSGALDVTGKGSGSFEDLSVTASGSATCPGGWNFVAGGDAELIRAWIVITGYDSNNNIVKQSEEIDLAWN